MSATSKSPQRHIVLTSHFRQGTNAPQDINWGAEDPKERGPVIATLADPVRRNAIGTHSGSYTVYRAMAVSTNQMAADHRPDLHNTHPVVPVGPHPQWFDPDKIVSIDPWGHMVGQVYAEEIEDGLDTRPSIAITKARLTLPEVQGAIAEGRLKPDGEILLDTGEISVVKVAVEPVWHLPSLAKRFGVDEMAFRRTIFEQTGGMFPDLVTRPDLQMFLPPIGGATAYIMGDPATLADPAKKLACRVHDECNGSDVFGSDICTCRPYLMHGIEVCVETAQEGGAGLIVYNRKEGRALGEVTKFLVYNARKRQEGGDTAAKYFERTECVAGVQDARFQELMPDIIHWLGITRIDKFVSMSDMKHDALASQGVEIVERMTIPDELVPPDAQVEMEAKKAAGYFTPTAPPTEQELAAVKGRDLASF